MKRNYLFWVFSVMGLIMLSLTSCSKDDEGDENDKSNSAYEREMIAKLEDTSWKMSKKVDKHGETETAYGTLTFSSEIDSGGRLCYFINADGKGTDYIGNWWLTDDKLTVHPYQDATGAILSVVDISPVLTHFGYDLEFEEISDSKLILSYWGGTIYYNRVNYTEGTAGGSSGGGQGGSSSGEEIAFVNQVFRATRTSITADFYTNVKAESATVRYGTSSPSKVVNCTITDKQIRATVTGLKAGTKYYFNCTVKKNGVTKTYPTTPAMTNY